MNDAPQAHVGELIAATPPLGNHVVTFWLSSDGISINASIRGVPLAIDEEWIKVKTIRKVDEDGRDEYVELWIAKRTIDRFEIQP